MIIRSRSTLLEGVLPDFNETQIKNEPMLFNCDLEHAAMIGGPLTGRFIQLLPADWRNVPLVIDSRSHMLMPGWFPCIPGWHHDDVPRTRADGQPNYDEGQMRSQHIMALVNGDICPTQFALGAADFEVPETGTIYAKWHGDVERCLIEGTLTSSNVPTNRLVQFDDRTWHQGTMARRSGWRWFIRASRYFDPQGNVVCRPNPRTNEVRKQVQVYMPAVNAGW